MFSDNGLDWLAYGARFYDATTARWWVRDPKAEKYYALTPYNYVAGNPVIMVDPDGMSAEDSDEKSDFQQWFEAWKEEKDARSTSFQQRSARAELEMIQAIAAAETAANEADPDDPPKGKKDREENSTLSEIKLFWEKADDWSYTWGPDVAKFLLDINIVYTVIYNGKVIFTGSDIYGKQKESGYDRYVEPFLQISLAATPSNAKVLHEQISDIYIRYVIGKLLSDTNPNKN